MAHIARLKLKNFKSFKIADLPLPKTFVCFAGSNGSGKSNVMDSIRFVLGETSLKSMRARKIKDLIHADAKSAEVTLYFDAGTKEKPEIHEIKRVIREDGKISYRLDGDKTTRSAIVEFLKKYNLDSSGRNTIAQGEVQRIINMSGKERRIIIDSVAGISDFEEKKKEALSDLQTVESRIKEAHLVMGERRAYLADLEREREVALQYQSANKKLSDAKGTLLKSEAKRLEKDLETFLLDERKIEDQIKLRQETASTLSEQMTLIEAERAKISAELSKKQNTHLLIRKSEELKATLAANKIRVSEQETQLSKLKTDKEILRKSVEQSEVLQKQMNSEIDKMKKELQNLESELEKLPKKGENNKLIEKRSEIEKLEKDALTIENSMQASKSEEHTNAKLLAAKNEELKSLHKTLPSDKFKSSAEKDAESADLKSKIKALVNKIDEQFSLTKKLNAEMSEIDKKMLEVKEKSSIYKVRSSPALANPALTFINELKNKGRSSSKEDGELSSGIYGLVADLISFDPKYAQAVEAAAGSRLFYVVVDSVDTAARIINKLKSTKAGRATFIPLDKIVSTKSHKFPDHRSIFEYLNFDHSVERAISYVFAETMLVKDLADAKSIGIGQVRMVSIEGEIFERSGVMSGGRGEGSAMGASLLRKFEMELSELKSNKDNILSELYSIRDHESQLRSEKSNFEIRLKTIELEEKINAERSREFETVLERKSKLEHEISECADSIERAQKTQLLLHDQIKSAHQKVQEAKKELEHLETKIKSEEDDKDRKFVETSSAISSLSATIDGKKREIEIVKKEAAEKQVTLTELDNSISSSRNLLAQISSEIGSQNKELLEVEKTISATGKEIEGLFSKMRSLEKDISDLSKKSTIIKNEIDKHSKDLNQISLKKVAITTHLEDLQTELSKMSSFEEIDFDKKELEQIISESEKLISSLGNINMAAIEMYEKKKLEIEEVELKINTLDQEREAILNMINQIEDQKKEIFNETFDIISSNFSNMFKYINVGQGHLQLDKPAEPFNSGLFIKIRRNNKDYSLDALSGGEKTLIALMFIFALQFFKPSPFYILDEVDAALDKPNSKNLSDLIAKMAADSQFILVSHNDIIMSNAETVIGVAKTEGASKLVGINLKQQNSNPLS